MIRSLTVVTVAVLVLLTRRGDPGNTPEAEHGDKLALADEHDDQSATGDDGDTGPRPEGMGPD